MMIRIFIKITGWLLLIAALGLLGVYYMYDSSQEKQILNVHTRSGAPGDFIQLREGTVHYRLQGEASYPLVVFIHGGGITGEEVWSKNIPYFLEQNYRVLSYDLFGRGYSDRTPEQSPELYQRQLIHLLDTLKLNPPFHMVALSMGAIVALDYITNHPKDVRKLVLVDPAASGDFKANPLLQVPVISDFLMSVYWYPRAVENQRKEFANKELFNSYADRLRYFMEFEGYKEINHATWMNVLNQNRLDLIQNIDPENLLIIYGAADPYYQQGQRKLYKQRVPSIQFVEVPDAGHMPNYERPEKVNHVLDSFLNAPDPANGFQYGSETISGTNPSIF